TFGASVDSIGDLDGDGRDELLIGAPGFYPSASGFARLVSGATGATIRDFVGIPGQNMGSVVARMGDANFDGVPDFAIASGGTMVSGSDAGATTFVLSGATGATLAAITGPSQYYAFGTSIRGGADFTGDGRPELLIGSPYETFGSLVNAGVVRAVS